MTKRQLSVLAMLNEIDFLFANKKTTWTEVEPVAEVHVKFKNVLEEIKTQNLKQQQSVTSGYTAQKNLKKKELVDKIFSISVKLRGFAKLKEDEILKKTVSYSNPALLKLGETQLLNHCQTIYEQILLLEPQLKGYNIDQEQIADLLNTISEYRPMVSIRNVVKGKRSSSTANVEQLMEKAGIYLDNLDDMVYGIIKDAEFLESYEQARKINDPRSRKSTKEGSKPEEEKPAE